MQDKIKETMAVVFRVGAEEVGEDASPDNMEQWDSINHMKLVAALEEEFDIRLTDSEIIEMANLKLVRLIIDEKVKG